ncbi:MAG TPA: hypothetical protein VN655_01605 [Pseudolabrys sp.]|jgi:hypothetical protein|nr:hypothetical protein [Pseudolabrys sp.]
MAFAHPAARQHRRPRRGGHGPLAAPLILFLIAGAAAASYVGYVLWPRWPDTPVALDTPALPIVVAGAAFNIEPAAIRNRVQRRPGTQDRVDLAYVWPTLAPPDPAEKAATPGAPIQPLERLFVTIEGADGTMPPIERVETIYPRYLVAEPAAGPPGLTLRGFRKDTPYAGEELAFESTNPQHFLARCSRRGAVGSGSCLLEKRLGEANLTFRFPRAWLDNWQQVAQAIDTLIARLQRK